MTEEYELPASLQRLISHTTQRKKNPMRFIYLDLCLQEIKLAADHSTVSISIYHLQQPVKQVWYSKQGIQ